MRTTTFSGILLLLAFSLLLPTEASAAVVGRISQVEGRVDLLKKGQLPATPVKLEDGLEKGDVIRTKSLSKAQITFIDESTLTIAPESRIAIEEYMVDESKGKRNAVLKMFQGLALAVVSKIYQSEKPNFVVKTQTAIMGIRGTEVGIRLYPNYSEFLDFKGRVRVQSISPQIKGMVELGPDHGTRVHQGLPPTVPFEVGAGERDHFMRQLRGGLQARVSGRDSQTEASSSEGSKWGPGSADSNNITIVSISPTLKPATQETLVSATPRRQAVVPPPPPPPPGSVEPQSISPSYSYSGPYAMSFDLGHKMATYTAFITFPNSNLRSVITLVATDPLDPGNFAKSSSGTIDWTLSGTLYRDQGSSGPYTGTLVAKGTSSGGTTFGFSLSASLLNGKLTVTSVGPVSGGYVSGTPIGTPDFTSPGSSGKITSGSALISWNIGAIPVTPPPPAPPPETWTQKSLSPPVTIPLSNYTMISSEGHQNATFTGSLLINGRLVQYTVVTNDPATPGDFVKSASGTITWTVTGPPLTNNKAHPDSYTGPMTITGTTSGGTVFTFSVQATYTNGKLSFGTSGPLNGTYVAISENITPDFTSPGSSHKVTPGSATITWTSTTGTTMTSTTPLAATGPTLLQAPTAVATTPLSQNTALPLATATPLTTTLTTATCLLSTNVISVVNTLPSSPILTTVTGPPGTSGAGNPGGPQGSPAAVATGPPVVAGPPGLTGNVPAVVGGGGSPVLASTAPGLSGTAPGLSGSAPGLSGATPGLSVSGPPGLSGGAPPGLPVGGPPGLSGGGPPGQLKDKGK